jgi:hypothetical protein
MQRGEDPEVAKARIDMWYNGIALSAGVAGRFWSIAVDPFAGSRHPPVAFCIRHKLAVLQVAPVHPVFSISLPAVPLHWFDSKSPSANPFEMANRTSSLFHIFEFYF